MIIAKEFRLGTMKDRILSPFSDRYRGKIALAAEARQLQAVMPFLLVSRDGKMAYVKNSKCGCTSISQAIHFYDTGSFFDGNIHREGTHLRQGYGYWQENRANLASGKPFLFSFVRDPAARFVSAYMDFVVLGNNPEARQYRDEFASRGLDKVDDLSSGLDRFLDLVGEQFEVDPLLADRHWRPQVFNLGGDMFDYQMIGRMEKFSEDFQKIREALGIAFEKLPVPTANRSGSGRLAPTRTQLRKICDLFAIDYESYGY